MPHAFFESLESRRLLAFAGTFTDTDNDVYAVELLGAGNAVVTTSNGGTSGFIQNLQVTGTDTKSILRVRVTNAAGDGRIPLQVLNTTVLRQLLMPAVDLRPNGDVDVADAAKIVMGNIGDSSDVRFDFDPALTGSRSASFGTAVTSIIRVLGPGSAITFQSMLDGSLNVFRGAKSITSRGDFIAGILAANTSPAASIGSIRAVGVARLNGVIEGDVGSIRAASFIVSNASNALSVSGVIGSIQSTGANAGRFIANQFGPVRGTDFSGYLRAREPDDLGVTFKSIAFSGAMTGQIGLADPPDAASVPGVIRSLSAGSIDGNDITAAGIGTMRVKNDWVNANMNLSGVVVGPVLRSLTVGGVARGDLLLQGEVGAMRFGAIGSGAPLSISDGPGTHRIASITAKGNVNPTNLNLDLGSVGKINIGNNLGTSVFNLNRAFGPAIDSMVVKGFVSILNLDTLPTVGITSINFGGLLSSTIDTAFITTLRVGTGDNGGIQNSNLTLFGSDASGFALRTAIVGTGILNSDIDADQGSSGNIGSITTPGFSGSNVNARRIGSIVATGQANGEALVDTGITTVDIAPGGFSIGRLDLRGAVTFAEVHAAGSIDRFSAATLFQANVSAGGPIEGTGLPADLTGFVPASINRFTLTAKFDPASFSLNRARVIASNIGAISIAGRINTTGMGDGGFSQGFGARTFGPVAIRDNAGTLIKPVISATPGDYGVLNPAGNFLFRVYA